MPNIASELVREQIAFSKRQNGVSPHSLEVSAEIFRRLLAEHGIDPSEVGDGLLFDGVMILGPDMRDLSEFLTTETTPQETR